LAAWGCSTKARINAVIRVGICSKFNVERQLVPERFRNTAWNDQISNLFFTKLARARDQAQYLRIQAFKLARSLTPIPKLHWIS